jgi:V/A-type H+-transporting ATPase subunit I
MAIEKLQKIHIVCPKEIESGLVDKLYKLNVIHIDALSPEYIKDGRKYFAHPVVEPVHEEVLFKIESIFTVFKNFNIENKGLISSFLPEDEILTERDFNKVIKDFDLDGLYEEVHGLLGREAESVKKLNKLKEEKTYINSISDFPFPYSILFGTEQTESFIGVMTMKEYKQFILDEAQFVDTIFVYPFFSDKSKIKVFFLYLKEDRQKIEKIVKHYSIEKMQILTNFSGFIDEEVTRILNKEAEILKERKVIFNKVKELYSAKAKLLALRDYYFSQAKKERALSCLLEGKNFGIIRGFVRENDSGKIERIEKEFDNTFIVVTEPEEYDAVPVSLKNNALFRPFEMLVGMFGVPSYFAMDATPFVAIFFSLFFGLALGDVFYGLLIVLGCLYFLKRYRGNVGVEKFFKIFLCAGSIAVIVGFLTGSVAGNFFLLYFPGSLLTKMLYSVQIIDPASTDGSMQFIAFSIGLGILVQLIGILLSMIISFKRKRIAEGVFNGLGWLIFIPSVLLLFFVNQYPQIKMLDYTFIAIGSVLLLAGGWISVRQPLFKPVAAVVNIYGIRSSYGIVSFLGDALSYSRLFVLGLSTSILASSFNIVSKLMGGLLGTLGIFITLLLLLFGHGLTVIMNSLGAFVHSIRLNFLEFFGRFYDIGGHEFMPLGLELKNIRLVPNERGGKK